MEKLENTTEVQGSNGNVYCVNEYTCLDANDSMYFKITCTCPSFKYRGECKHIDKILTEKELPLEIADRYDYPVIVAKPTRRIKTKPIDENKIRHIAQFIQDNITDKKIYFTKTSRLTNEEFFEQNPQIAVQYDDNEIQRIKNDIHQYHKSLSRFKGDYRALAKELLVDNLYSIVVNNNEYLLNDICS